MHAIRTVEWHRASAGIVGFIAALMLAYVLGVVTVLVVESRSGPAGRQAEPGALIGSEPGDPGSAWNYSSRHHGTQSVEGPSSLSAENAPQPEAQSRRGGNRT